MSIQTKRMYEKLAKTDGVRFLVEQLWPRGVKKETAKLDGWFRDAAPSTALRKWFHHDSAKWTEFKRRYRAELHKHPEAWQPALNAAKHRDATLLFSSRDVEHNNVVELKRYLEEHLPVR